MNRVVVAGILGLALAGCARDRAAWNQNQARQGGVGQVGLPPDLPSIHASINREGAGREGGALLASQRDQPFLNLPGTVVDNRPPGASRSLASRPGTQSPPVPAAGTLATPPQEALAGASAPPPVPAPASETAAGRVAYVPPSDPTLSGPAMPDPLLGANPDVMPKIELTPAEIAANPAALNMPDPVADSLPPTDPATKPAAAPVVAPGPDPLLGPDPDVMPPLGSPKANPPAPVDPPAATEAPGPSSEPVPAPRTKVLHLETLPPVEGAPAPAGDPLLGADPDMMPTMPSIPSGPPAASATNPKAPEALPPKTKAKPKSKPTTSPQASGPAPEPRPTEPPPSEAPAPIADDPPPVELPPVEALPPASEVAPPPVAPPPGAATDPEGPRRTLSDGTIRRVAGDPTQARTKFKARELKEVSGTAARVGDDIITLHELNVAATEMFRRRAPGRSLRELSKEEKNMLGAAALEDLIERSLILQEARRKLKKPEQRQMINEFADKVWREQELPPLLRQYAVADEYALQQKLTEEGRTLTEMRQAFRDKFLAQSYMEQELGARMQVSIPEMRDYYNAHLREFDRAEQLTWREVLIEVEKSPGRVEAKRKADEALARLRRGEDFAAVAQTASDGPNKARGGLWQITPGSYGVASVNEALARLPIKHLSQVIEGPTSFHVVRVEDRRAAGPARFDEVQDEIKKAVYRQKVERESIAYIQKLRSRSIITTTFDNPPGDPAVLRAKATTISR